MNQNRRDVKFAVEVLSELRDECDITDEIKVALTVAIRMMEQSNKGYCENENAR